MDKDISNWVMEFLLRSSVPDSLIQKTLTVLPVSAADSRLKKTLLLRILQTQHLKASLSEMSLHILEQLEELHCNDAVPVPDAMRSAYCAVAVDSTVKYLISSPEDPSGEYFSAVRRIWRGRVVKLSALERRSGIFSDELIQWAEDIEAALWDVRVSERLVGLNTRRDAMNEVKRYLKEAWGLMGPSFLDSMASFSKAKDSRPEGVCEIASGGEMLRKRDDLGKEKMYYVGDGDDKNDNDNVVDDSDDDVAEVSENLGDEQLEERVGTSVDPNQEVGGCDSLKGDKEIRKGNLQPKRKYSSLRTCHRGVKISGAEEVRPTNLLCKYDSLPSAEVKKVRESLKSSSMELKALVKDPLPDALHTSELVRSKLATKDINLGPPIENQSQRVDVPDSNACKIVVLYQPKDAKLEKKSVAHCSNSHRPNLMEQWNDSIENLPHESQPRRKKRRWTSLEEETLRAGVKMFGEGNWRTIRDFYSNIFEYRSGVDLKDKWRNMLR
ncbi:uncharacterized protein [Cicer arietinum]|uniref:Uncharacterized protein LOC101503526 isoform X2 n=1 Tax=Cicer arietinum TaxID=3827 RepID=A0A3Q7XSB5_CICAR|nr:uncharacterized protein LOC101503526 isoform X2 [Cicer arietinum]